MFHLRTRLLAGREAESGHAEQQDPNHAMKVHLFLLLALAESISIVLSEVTGQALQCRLAEPAKAAPDQNTSLAEN
jgi:hypothetical protein